MGSDPGSCGPLHAVYAAAREDDREGMQAIWRAVEPDPGVLDRDLVDELDEAVAAGNTVEVKRAVEGVLFREEEAPTLTGRAATIVGTVLYWFGYVASFVLFFHAHSRESVVNRLRWAYRAVGVDVRDTETVDGVERTTFLCPYRNFGADRFGLRHACHDVLDRVDDGYVTWLERHRDIDYQRPRACAASGCCYSEVSEL